MQIKGAHSMRESVLKRAALFFFFIMLVSGCDRTPQDATTSDSLESVNKSGRLSAGYIVYPPSLSLDPNGGSLSGIMHDVISLVAQDINVELDYVEESTFATMVRDVDKPNVHIIVSGIWPTGSRARFAEFSDAVYYSVVKAYVRGGDSRFDGDLGKLASSQYIIATLDGEASAIIASEDYENAPTVSLGQEAQVSQLLLQVESGKADITFVEPAIAMEYLRSNPGAIQEVKGVPPVRAFPNTFLLQKGDAKLLSTINTTLQGLHNNGAIAKVISRYDPEGKLFLLVPTVIDAN